MDNRRIKEFRKISDKLNILTFSCDQSRTEWFSPSVHLMDLLELDEKDFETNPKVWLTRVPKEKHSEVLSHIGSLPDSDNTSSLQIPFIASAREATVLELTFCSIRDKKSGNYYLCSALDITEEERYKKEAIQSRDYEIEISARIQKSLLTGAYFEKNEFLDVCADTLPSKKVDGDFYEFISLSERSLDFIVGDVMGKGVPAALLAAAVKNSFFRALINQAVLEKKTPSIKGILGAIDDQIASELIALKKFLTLYYCRIDSSKSKLSYIDAGHTNIIYYCAEDECCWSLKGSNMPLGFVEGQDYRSYELHLGKGDLLFFYSDGITEVENSEGSQFGYERLEQLIFAHRHLDPEELIKKVLNVTFFYAADEFNDDVTVIAARIKNEADYPVARKISSYEDTAHIDLEEIRNTLVSDIGDIFIDFDSDELSRLLIAYTEALTNCMKFSCGPLIPGWYVSRERLILTIEFFGPDFEWTNHRNPDVSTFQSSGYGLYLIHNTVDSFLLLRGSGDKKKIVMIREFKWD